MASTSSLAMTAAEDADATMLQNVISATGLPEVSVASLLMNDDDLGALFDTVLSGLFERFSPQPILAGAPPNRGVTKRAALLDCWRTASGQARLLESLVH